MQKRNRIPVNFTLAPVVVEHLNEMAGVYGGLKSVKSRIIEQLIEQKYEIYKEMADARKRTSQEAA